MSVTDGLITGTLTLKTVPRLRVNLVPSMGCVLVRTTSPSLTRVTGSIGDRRTMHVYCTLAFERPARE